MMEEIVALAQIVLINFAQNVNASLMVSQKFNLFLMSLTALAVFFVMFAARKLLVKLFFLLQKII